MVATSPGIQEQQGSKSQRENQMGKQQQSSVKTNSLHCRGIPACILSLKCTMYPVMCAVSGAYQYIVKMERRQLCHITSLYTKFLA